MNLLSVSQGSEAWHAARATHFCASEAPIVMGASKYSTRAALLREKKTGVVADVEPPKQALFDRGHASEAAARVLLEEDLGEELFPCTVEKGELLASLDGITMDESTIFEHKLHSDALAAQVRAGELEPHYYWQLEQQLLVTGAERVIFVTSDGTREHWAQMEYRAVPGRAEALMAAWQQFAIDLAGHQPDPAPLPAAAPVVETLPAVSVRMDGALVVHSNLDAFGTALRAFIDRIPTKPSTDDEFLLTDVCCKALKRAEGELEAEEGRALASMADVEKMRRLVGDLRNLARTTRLQREKLVEARKMEIRNEEIARGKAALVQFVTGLNATIGKPYMPLADADWVGAIRGKKTVQSVRDAIDQELAAAKIRANEVCGRIVINMRALRELAADHAFLFADTPQLVLKAEDDCKAVITSRIAEHCQRENARLEAERARIRAEEEAKVRAEAAAAERQRMQEQAREAAEAAAAKPISVTGAETLSTPVLPASTVQAVGPGSVYQIRTPAPTSPPTLRLGVLNERLGFSVTADFMRSLGIDSTKDRSAVLFQDDMERICVAIIGHLIRIRDQREAA